MEYIPSYYDFIQHGAEPSWRDELYHYGVKGMRWGIRRYQNYDGTWKKKARIGSAERVRQKQRVISSKIDSDGILGKGDTNFVRRLAVNDRRRGRVTQLKNKAENREAIKAYRKNRTKENARKVAKTTAKRVGANLLDPYVIGRYKRYRSVGNGKLGSASVAIAPYYPTGPGHAIGLTIGEAMVDHMPGNIYYEKSKQNRRKYAKRTGQTSRL